MAQWLGNASIPRRLAETWGGNPLYQAIVLGLKQFYSQSPAIKSMHISFQGSQTIAGSRLTIVWLPSMGFTAKAPGYAEWIFEADVHHVYGRYRKILGLIAGGDTRHWLLKDPTHLFASQAMLDTFPDVCVVYKHGDLVSSMTSVSNMIYHYLRVREIALNKKKECAILQKSVENPADNLFELFLQAARPLDYLQDFVNDIFINI